MMDFDPVSYAMGAKSGGGGSTGGGVLVVHGDETGTLDRTWQEIHNADLAVIPHQMDEHNKYTMPVMLTLSGEAYEVYALMYDDSPVWMKFLADSASGYPVISSD